MLNYDLLQDLIQQINENHPFSVPTWIIVFITVFGTLMDTSGIAIYCYCKYRRTKIKPYAFPDAWYKNDLKYNKKDKSMLPSSSQ